MVDVQGTLEREIADPRMRRDDVALTYAFGIRDEPDAIDWAKINRLIMARWSINALRYIKESAWRRVNPPAARGVKGPTNGGNDGRA